MRALQEKFNKSRSFLEDNSESLAVKSNPYGVDVPIAIVTSVFEARPDAFSRGFAALIGDLTHAINVEPENRTRGANGAAAVTFDVIKFTDKSKTYGDWKAAGCPERDDPKATLESFSIVNLSTGIAGSNLDGLSPGCIVRLCDITYKGGWSSNDQRHSTFVNVKRVERVDGVTADAVAVGMGQSARSTWLEPILREAVVPGTKYGTTVTLVVRQPHQPIRDMQQVDGSSIEPSYAELTETDQWKMKGMQETDPGTPYMRANFITQQWMGSLADDKISRTQSSRVEVTAYESSLSAFCIRDTAAWVQLAPQFIPNVPLMLILGPVNVEGTLGMEDNNMRSDSAKDKPWDFGICLYANMFLIDSITTFRRVAVPCTVAFARANCVSSKPNFTVGKKTATLPDTVSAPVVCISEMPIKPTDSIPKQPERDAYRERVLRQVEDSDGAEVRVLVNCSMAEDMLDIVSDLSDTEGDLLLAALLKNKRADMQLSGGHVSIQSLGKPKLYFMALFPARQEASTKKLRELMAAPVPAALPAPSSSSSSSSAAAAPRNDQDDMELILGSAEDQQGTKRPRDKAAPAHERHRHREGSEKKHKKT